jgi:hypothetical protein
MSSKKNDTMLQTVPNGRTDKPEKILKYDPTGRGDLES